MRPDVLVIDDDRFLLEALGNLLGNYGFETRLAASAADGWILLKERLPDVLILDVNLPDTDGVSLCRKIRREWRFPLLMLTARAESIDKVVGLEVGADDYLTKPFQPAELVARVRALLRRSTEYAVKPKSNQKIRIGDLLVDPDAGDAYMAGIPTGLTHKEFCLLHHLAENQGRLVLRDSLLEHNWSYGFVFNRNNLDVHIYRLRKKLEPDFDHPQYLHTIRGFGYKLEHMPK